MSLLKEEAFRRQFEQELTDYFYQNHEGNRPLPNATDLEWLEYTRGLRSSIVTDYLLQDGTELPEHRQAWKTALIENNKSAIEACLAFGNEAGIVEVTGETVLAALQVNDFSMADQYLMGLLGWAPVEAEEQLLRVWAQLHYRALTEFPPRPEIARLVFRIQSEKPQVYSPELLEIVGKYLIADGNLTALEKLLNEARNQESKETRSGSTRPNWHRAAVSLALECIKLGSSRAEVMIQKLLSKDPSTNFMQLAEWFQAKLISVENLTQVEEARYRLDEIHGLMEINLKRAVEFWKNPAHVLDADDRYWAQQTWKNIALTIAETNRAIYQFHKKFGVTLPYIELPENLPISTLAYEHYLPVAMAHFEDTMTDTTDQATATFVLSEAKKIIAQMAQAGLSQRDLVFFHDALMGGFAAMVSKTNLQLAVNAVADVNQVEVSQRAKAQMIVNSTDHKIDTASYRHLITEQFITTECVLQERTPKDEQIYPRLRDMVLTALALNALKRGDWNECFHYLSNSQLSWERRMDVVNQALAMIKFGRQPIYTQTFFDIEAELKS
jgi:hypothetical protein